MHAGNTLNSTKTETINIQMQTVLLGVVGVGSCCVVDINELSPTFDANVILLPLLDAILPDMS